MYDDAFGSQSAGSLLMGWRVGRINHHRWSVPGKETRRSLTGSANADDGRGIQESWSQRRS